MTDISRFQAIFAGLDCAYGTYRLPKEKRADGKQSGQASVIRQPPTDDLWVKHLEGIEPSLGIIPIRADNTCIWGCIDIDQYPLDHKALVARIAGLKLPLVVCRSKSGGAHCFCFTREPVPAADMQAFLRNAAAMLGEAGREIFPKQCQILVERGDTGNFLNLPYFGGDNSLRYAVKPDGSAATLEEFYALHAQYAQAAPLVPPEPPKAPAAPIKDGPPCLQALCTQGVPEGGRNITLFNVGVYLKRKAPGKWEDDIAEHNLKYVSPNLQNQEVQTIIKQLHKKEYKYQCKDAPLKSFCNSGLCRTRKFGIGADAPDAPRIASLSKYASEPPLWFLDVNGKRVELDTEALHNQTLFQRACLEKINILPPTLRRNDWEAMLAGLLREMVETSAITEASEDTGVTGRFRDLLEEFTTHMQQAMDRDEILMGRPWTDEKTGLTWFRLKDLEGHLARNRFREMTAPQMAQRLRDMGGEPASIMLKGRTARVWRIPQFVKQEAPFSVKAVQEVPF